MRRVVVPLEVAAPVAKTGAAVHELRGKTMGTTWSVKLAVGASGPPPDMQARIQRCLDDIVAQMSPWETDSDISRFNRAPAGSWHVLPADFFHVLAYAMQAARDSSGAFDPTAGALVNLWGFGPPRHHGDAAFGVPDAQALAQARACTGWQRIVLDTAAQRAQQPGGALLDLSAVAKGFGVDRLSRLLHDSGLHHHLVDVGGELRGTGTRPDGQPWWVALEAPPPDLGLPGIPVQTIVALHGLSVATSGDYRRAFVAGGQRHCHSIDPRSGRPISHGLASVSVLHRECMVADAQSTALTVMGLEPGLAHARRHGLAAHFVHRSAGGLEEHLSDALVAML